MEKVILHKPSKQKWENGSNDIISAGYSIKDDTDENFMKDDIIELDFPVKEFKRLRPLCGGFGQQFNLNLFELMIDLYKKDQLDYEIKLSQLQTPFNQEIIINQQRSQNNIAEQQHSIHQEQLNIPKCPTCGSTNVQKISAGSRWLSTGLFGLGSSKVGKTMECRNCGYKW